MSDQVFSAVALEQALSAVVTDATRFAIAYSGGADSTALLVALREIQQQIRPEFDIRALHFNHRIHPDADRWQSHCERFCARTGVVIDATVWLDSPGLECSEHAARSARYRWIESNLQDEEVLLTAHHRNDQTETVLLNALEGRGAHRLAGIPAARALNRGGNRVARPLLGFTGQSLREYLSLRQISWLEDPANTASRHRRSFLRQQVLPLIRQRFPDCDQALVAAAARLGEVTDLVDEFTADTLLRIEDEAARRTLCLAPPIRTAALLDYSAGVQRALLRRWIHDACIRSPSDNQLDEFIRQLRSSVDKRADGHGNRAVLDFCDHQLVASGRHLYLVASRTGTDHGTFPFTATEQIFPNRVGVRMTPADGFAIDDRCTTLHWRWRQGGERFQPAGESHSRSLKKMLHAADIPGFERRDLPLLWDGETILWVHGLGFSDALSRSVARSAAGKGVVPRFFIAPGPDQKQQ